MLRHAGKAGLPHSALRFPSTNSRTQKSCIPQGTIAGKGLSLRAVRIEPYAPIHEPRSCDRASNQSGDRCHNPASIRAAIPEQSSLSCTRPAKVGAREKELPGRREAGPVQVVSHQPAELRKVPVRKEELLPQEFCLAAHEPNSRPVVATFRARKRAIGSACQGLKAGSMHRVEKREPGSLQPPARGHACPPCKPPDRRYGFDVRVPETP
jgi:hypothetical protein